MKAGMFLILPLFLILISSTFVVYAYSTEANEDIEACCRDGDTLIYRYSYDEYVCVEPSTAKRWVDLGMAEIIEESKPVDEEQEMQRIQKQYEIAPPPPPKPSTPIDNECQVGQTLVFNLIHQDEFCISNSMAKSWERLGLVTIVEKSDQTTTDQTTTNTDSLNEETTDLASYFSYEEGIHEITPKLWFAIDSESKTSMFIEGDDDITVVDSLSSFNSTKKIFDEFKTISNKPVKLVVLTTINSEFLNAAKNFLNPDTLIVVNSNFVEELPNDLGLYSKNIFSYNSQFEIDIPEVATMKLVYNENLFRSNHNLHSKI